VAKVLISAAGPAMAPLLALTRPTFEAFARRHGYQVELHDLDDDHERSHPEVRRAKWRKVELLTGALQRADVVVWIDADAAVTRFDRDIADDLPARAFQGLVLERFPGRVNPNTGVWVLRRGDAAQAFLDAVSHVGQLAHSWADQATVCHLLGWELGDFHGHGARPVRATPYAESTAWLAPTWNVVGHDRPDARIRHVAGRPLDERRRILAGVVDRLGADGELDA
jgi:hypothetical protein